MLDATEYRFKIDAYTPDTMPMWRLAEYMAELSVILGEREDVHFVRLEASSTVLVHKVDAEADPKVTERVEKTRRGEGPSDAMTAVRVVNRKLREDKTKAALFRGTAEILPFPGSEAQPRVVFPPFNQVGILDGTIIRIGGRAEVVPVFLDAGTRLYPNCKAQRSMARRLAVHLFGPELRVKGTGRWHVDEVGTWVLDNFTITDFDVLDDAPLKDVVEELRAIPDSGWDAVPDPWADLMDIRHGPTEAH